MIIVILTLLTFIIVCISGIREDEPFLGFCFALILALIMFVMTTMLTLLLLIPFYNKANKEYINKDTEIYSLNTTSSAYGSFCLGIGSVKNGAVYYYYTKDKDDFYNLDYCYASNTKIKEDNSETPKLRKTYYKFTNPVLNFLSPVWLGNNFDKQYLIVPVGTIRQEFNGNVGD